VLLDTDSNRRSDECTLHVGGDPVQEAGATPSRSDFLANVAAKLADIPVEARAAKRMPAS
jgi:hypothetical protein